LTAIVVNLKNTTFAVVGSDSNDKTTKSKI